MGQVKPGGRPRGKKIAMRLSPYMMNLHILGFLCVCMYVWATLCLYNRTEIKWKLSKNDL